jgi:pyruvate/2-oxoglutarate dehydrogenase complex dihydrolipoamide dehydrogenase (E3) component
MERSFDAVVIGAGQAGPFLAARLVAAGKKVALVERKLIGGTCVNAGCTPTKAMVASTKVAFMAASSGAYGVHCSGPARIDLRAIKARKDAIVAGSHDGLESWLGGLEGLTIVRGSGRFESAVQVRIADDVLTAKQFFVNVGGRPRTPDFPGVGEVPYLTSTTILDLDQVPEHLLVVGGSYIGLEFAQMFRRFGAEVTVVERGAQLLPHEDVDVSAEIKATLEAEGIRFRLNAECISLHQRGSDVAVGVSCQTGLPEERGSHILLAVGRDPNTHDLGLDKAGVKTDPRGFIEVDDQLRSSVPGIWALGDCNGRGAFTHTSYNDFEIVAANLLDNGSRRVTDRTPAYALYIDPPVGRVGMNEAQVRKSGRKALIAKRPMTKVSRAVEKGETRGFMKVLVDADTREILGATIFGVGGDEAVHTVLAAITAKQKADVIANAVFIHPTVAELLPTVFQSLQPMEG